MTRTVTITFSEAMNTTIAPTVTGQCHLDADQPDERPLGRRHPTMQLDYTVADANVTLANVTFGVSGAQTPPATPRSRSPPPPPPPPSTRRTPTAPTITLVTDNVPPVTAGALTNG